MVTVLEVLISLYTIFTGVLGTRKEMVRLAWPSLEASLGKTKNMESRRVVMEILRISSNDA